jgi:hypothetical protein
MIARMEELQRGERVLPPCDRCRRLHMDCLKNLTACVGCTKKHAKCSWRDVKEEEIISMRAGTSTATTYDREREHEEPTISPPQFARGLGPLPPISAERERRDPYEETYHARRESAPSAPNPAPTAPSTVPMELPSTDNSPRRAVSETEGRPRLPARSGRPDDEDPDANQRLMQAILDTVDHHTRVAAAVQEKERGTEREIVLPAPANEAYRRERERDMERERERNQERERERTRERQQREQQADLDRDRRSVQA